MTFAMGCLGSSTDELILRRDSFSLKLSPRLSPRVRRGCTSLTPSGESWKTWISEERGTKLSHVQLPIESPSLQLNIGRRTFANAEFIACSKVQKSICFAKHILQALGRALFILGLGLSPSLPASARAVASPVSEVSVSKNREENENVDAIHPKTDASYECDNFTKDSVLSDLDTSKTTEERLNLSEAFWMGIPTPEGSLMYRLKIQLDMNPSDSRALEALLQAVLEQQDMLRALTVLETLLEVQPTNCEWKFLKARTHESLGELLMAKQEYEELLSLHPLSARFLQGLVMLLNAVGEQTQALELIQKALNQAISEGKDVEARNLGVLLSQFYIQLGNFEDALHQLSSMIEKDPDDFRPYLCQGLAYALMNQMDKAKQSFKKYMQLCPSDAFDQNYLAGLLLKAEASKRLDALKKDAMKSTLRNRSKLKAMKQPSLFGNLNPHHEVFSE